MKKVTVYSIDRKNIQVGMLVDTVPMYQYDNPHIFTESYNGRELTVGDGVRRISIPVKAFHRHHGDDYGHTRDEVAYIAIDPELEDLLTAETREKLRDISVENHGMRCRIDELKENMYNWWKQPWYKRVWCAIKGGW